MKKGLLLISIVFFVCSTFSQDLDSLQISKIYSNALGSYNAYNNLRYLCKNIGGRVTGSPEAAAAVEFGRQVLDSLELDTVYLQPLTVNVWKRGKPEIGTVVSSKFGSAKVEICALGTSIGTGNKGITAEVIEVTDFAELEKLGKEKVQGKIVFFNKPWNQSNFFTFYSYGENAQFRVSGAMMAAKYSAVAVLVRSLASEIDEFPHTGIMRYDSIIPKIPAAALCTRDADLLSRWLAQDKKLTFYLEMYCHSLESAPSFNVIGELKGTEYPNEIITVGGHLDSWDLGEGAHDDGIGCMHSIDVVRIFKELGIKPKHTIRVVLFMDEETHQVGGKKYAAAVSENNEKHVVAIESDEGGTSPTGFSLDAPDSVINKLQQWLPYFLPYGSYAIKKGWGGVDIGMLKDYGISLIGLNVDSQRYFQYHHSNNDTFEKVNRREMQIGSASIASLVYLIDKYGL